MRLTRHTDYSLRVLLYLGARPDRLASIGEIAGAHGISKNHLMKVVQRLAEAGLVATVRGAHGGLRLGRAPSDINLGAVVRATEQAFELADCTHCRIAPACALRSTLDLALLAFMNVLDARTLQDLLGEPERLISLLEKPRRQTRRRSA